MRREVGDDCITSLYRADSKLLDEGIFADEVVKSLGINHKNVFLTSDEILSGWDRVVLRQGEPFTTTSIFAQSEIFFPGSTEWTKVVIDGQGADELLIGYQVFRSARVAELIKRGRLREANRILLYDTYAQLPASAARLLPRPADRILRKIYGKGRIPRRLNSTWFQRWIRRDHEASMIRGTLSAEIEASISTTSLPMLLRFADRNAMASSVENRVPFLTPAIAHFARDLSSELLIDNDGWTKPVLRDAVKNFVPDSVLRRRDKIGFQTPEDNWALKNPDFCQHLLAYFTSNLPSLFLNEPNEVAQCIENGKVSGETFRIVSVLAWAQMFSVEFPS